MNVSFVVIGLNEGALLSECFESIKHAIKTSVCIDAYEILYVDSGSSDSSVSIAKNHTATVYSILSDRSAAAARKIGLLNSKYEFVLFLDGDMQLDINFINEVYSRDIFKLHGLCGVTGKRKEVFVDVVGNKSVITDDYYGRKGKGRLSHLGGASLFRRVDGITSQLCFDESQVLWEESLFLYGVISNGGYFLGLDIPFIVHNNKKKPSFFKTIKSYLSDNGTGYYFARLIYKSISEGYFIGLVKCQWSLVVFAFLLSLCIFLIFSRPDLSFMLLIFLNCLLFFLFGIKKTAHLYLRVVWVIIFPFLKKKKFDLDFKKEGE
ncbi:glycosyltransferase [Aeromonas simiae]|uniref:glycosyltransferase n=1 Tax=Aeromonas simiae TaxID=218936 RepID=UPI00266CD5BA|nr:glycosyltransferase [Aeromonas simiae]MDO2947929.1 glycosyltransferase [Aeromonas simiae]MDO2955312.1 glycosyltransferase [Aeromonas simiae]